MAPETYVDVHIVQVDSDAAAIRVGAGDPGSPVSVELVDGAGNSLPDHLVVVRDGDRLHVKVRTVREQRWRRARSFEARLRIVAAPDVELEVRTDAGAVKVEGREAPIAIHASAGAIKLDRVSGPIDLETNAGAVKVVDSHGDAKIRTDAGAIKLERHHAEKVDLHTGAGGVKATELHVDDARVITEIGGAKLLFERAPKNVDVTCTLGAIEVLVPRERYRIVQETGMIGRASLVGLESDPDATRTVRVATTGMGALKVVASDPAVLA